MPLPQGVRCVLNGTAPGGEIFETGFFVNTRGIADHATLQAFTDGVRDSLEAAAAFADMKALIRNDSSYNSVTGYYYPGGTTKSEMSAESPLTGGTGTGGNATLPLATCLVATLRTGRAGRSYRGRMYLPASGVSLDPSTHQVALATCQTLATDMAGFFGDVNNNGDGEQSVAVASTTLGTSLAVSQVSVDTKTDVQRRRQAGEAIVGMANANVS